MQWLMLLVSTAAISSALPAEGSEGLVKRDVTIATFDDLAIGDPIPVPYKGLNFENAYLDTDVQPFNNHKLVIAQSEPQYISARADNASSPFVTINGTDNKSFDLDSFYFGSIDARGETVQGCEFTITGFDAKDKALQVSSVVYTPQFNEDYSAPMQEVQLGWKGLQAFSITVDADAATLERLAVFIDNVQYTIYQ